MISLRSKTMYTYIISQVPVPYTYMGPGFNITISMPTDVLTPTNARISIGTMPTKMNMISFKCLWLSTIPGHINIIKEERYFRIWS